MFYSLLGDPCPQPKQLEISDMAECNKNFGYDYFTGSGNSFLIILGTVLLFPIRKSPNI